jgi:molybdopterin-guanine dinucleotide biosynthesis protein A
MSAPIYGLLLAGGQSRRMQRDKAALEYAGEPQLARAARLLQPLVSRLFVSVRAGQELDAQRSAFAPIVDRLPDLGPLGGIHAALHTHTEAAWLVLACDLPFLDVATLQQLIAARVPQKLATAYRSRFDAMPEPLCAIWEPASRSVIDTWIAQGKSCPRSFMKHHDVALLELNNSHALDNINTAEEYLAARSEFSAATKSAPVAGELRHLHVQYFASLRDQAGRSEEAVTSAARTPRELYAELRARHQLGLSAEQLRVAVNEDFADWNHPLQTGDNVVFLPPVAGG